ATGVFDGFGQEFFGAAVAVGGGGVEEVDPAVVGLVLEGDAIGIGELAPPVGAKDEVAKAQEAYGQVGTRDRSILHGCHGVEGCASSAASLVGEMGRRVPAVGYETSLPDDRGGGGGVFFATKRHKRGARKKRGTGYRSLPGGCVYFGRDAASRA